MALAQSSEPWQSADEMQPAAFAAQLTGSASKPLILYVGFPVLYKAARIPGAILAGPVGKPDGLASLKQAVASVPKDRQIVLYCGCCPFAQCPNMRPAFKTLHDLGYSNVKVVVIPTNLATDWIAKGYPIEKAANAPKL
jgi:rhodanese-related sulfurtransferase